MKPLLFAGPSLFGIQLKEGDKLDIRPPAKCGDILRAVRDGYQTIGLADGTFETEPSVWHKEVLFALSQGVAVYGAASIGALRAAECYSFGMVGVGKIFEAYASGRLTSDADVALLFGPAELNYLPLTVPLVDVEYVISAFTKKQSLSQEILSRIRKSAATLHYKNRTWSNLLAQAEINEQIAQQFLDELELLGPLQKAQDVEALVCQLSQVQCHKAPKYEFSKTVFFQKLERSV